MSTAATIDLTAFCAKGEPAVNRYTEPFIRSGWVYATNGYACVRVPSPGSPDAGLAPKNVPDVFVRPDFSPVPWPSDGIQRGEDECRPCDGHGYVGREQCEECDGTGQIECSLCSQETDCAECDGDGYVTDGKKCTTCDGTGRCEQEKWQRVGDMRVRGDFAGLIRALPGVQWAGNHHDRIHFLFDGGEGAVMRLLVPE